MAATRDLLSFPEPMSLSEAAEIALEDYALAVTRSLRAEAVRDGAGDAAVRAIRLEGLTEPPAEEAVRDVVAFARALADAGEGLGLGWS